MATHMATHIYTDGIDYQSVQINRLQDKASPAHKSPLDTIRSWWLLSKKNITAGRQITLKKGVRIAMCKTGTLTIGDYCLFHDNCWLLLTMPHPIVHIGKWVHVGRNTIIAGKNKIFIGDYTIIAPNCYIIDHEHGFAPSNVILNQRSTLKEVNIGRDCYLGTGCIVLAGIQIGDGAVIGAGSVVTRNIPARQVWGGNPAHYIKER